MPPFYRHIKLDGPSERKPYTSVQSGSKERQIPPRDRTRHGRKIYDQLQRAWDASTNRFLVARPDRDGVYLEFVSTPGFELMIKSLEDRRQRIRLCNVRTETNEAGHTTTYATVFVPQDKRGVFFKKVEQYLSEETKSGKPRNADLINSIEEVRTALFVASFWTDDNNLIPGEEPAWCEVWLRTTMDNEKEVLGRFEELVAGQGIPTKPGNILFPERAVKLVRANRAQLQEISMHSDDIAEYRRARDTADFFLSLKPFEQQEWADEFLARLSVDARQVTICILDTGVNRGHPLLSPVLPENACLAVREEWGTHDHQGHGTCMAGMAAYGNLMDVLSDTEHITLYHTLESVKILPPVGGNEPELWGDITAQAISLAEINDPDKSRVVCSAVTAQGTRDRGRPTSWSGAIDNITSGATDGVRRLVILAAGNVTAWNQLTNYPDTQKTDTVHDPGQSWNALTVGAYTRLTDLTDPALRNFQPLAQENQLSPFSTTSLIWESRWPNKPDVLFEGGNVAVMRGDPSNFVENSNDLSLVTTYYKPRERLFEQFNMTSAAAAQAAHFAARIQAMYPEYWPETIRGLIVHSSYWPDALIDQFVSDRRSKQEIGQLLRIAGYGVPDLEKALYCAANSLTLISEAEIQPFVKEQGQPPRTNEMHLYRLPWPKEVLEALGEVVVTMRITLSYFIEPGPGEIGWKDRYRYPSHGLRFKLNAPTESEEEFIARINKAVRDDEYEGPDTQSPSEKWMIGRNSRDKGSVHSDIWKGTAVELASTHLIAVHPSVGWWRERAHLKKVNKCTRYSLIVSIETPSHEVDIYTPVFARIMNRVPVPISAYV